MTDDTLAARLAKAAADGDYELAARLRDEMQGQGSKLRMQVPGRMGLGTSEQEARPHDVEHQTQERLIAPGYFSEAIQSSTGFEVETSAVLTAKISDMWP